MGPGLLSGGSQLAEVSKCWGASIKSGKLQGGWVELSSWGPPLTMNSGGSPSQASIPPPTLQITT